MLTDTLGHVLASRVLPANAADGPATIAFWDEVAAAHDLLGQVGFVDSSFHGVFRQHVAQRYGELRRLLPKITEKMLIHELRELESDGIVARAVHQTVPPRVDYSLTPLGQRVQSVFAELLSWGTQYLDRASSGAAPGN